MLILQCQHDKKAYNCQTYDDQCKTAKSSQRKSAAQKKNRPELSS